LAISTRAPAIAVLGIVESACGLVPSSAAVAAGEHRDQTRQLFGKLGLLGGHGARVVDHEEEIDGIGSHLVVRLQHGQHCDGTVARYAGVGAVRRCIL
jgi:hypothetical protein